MNKNYKRLLLSLIAGAVMSANASTVSMETSKAAGTKIAIAVNAGLNVEIRWDQQETPAETFLSDGALHEITVSGSTLKLTTDDDLTALYVNEAGLKSIIVTEAPTLERLFCAGNELTTLNLSSCNALKELDCQDNKLTNLSLGNANIEDLNVAGNQLTALGVKSNYVKNLRSIVCAGNKLTMVSYVSSMTNLRSLLAQDNQISSIAVSKCENLRTLVLSNNSLASFYGDASKAMENLWLDGNNIKEINLSNSSKVRSLVVRDNSLKTILWNKNCSKTLIYADLSENELFFNSFPTAYSTSKKIWTLPIVLAPQRDYKLCDYALVNTDYEDWRVVFYHNGYNTGPAAVLTITDNENNKLVQGTDYQYTSARLKFLTPHDAVNISATSTYYPDVTLKIAPFRVTTSDGIETIAIDRTDANQEVYTLSGIRVNNTNRLPKGIYIINGKKTVVK